MPCSMTCRNYIKNWKVVMGKREKTILWKDIKPILSKENKDGLLTLVKALYSLNKENKTFLETKYSLVDPLEPYKEIIDDSINPDLMDRQTLSLAEGRKAISRYRKAVGDPVGIIELMIHYVECGNKFTLNYGDIDEQFYDSLMSMFDNILKQLVKSDKTIVDKYLPRLRDIVNEVKGIGWGYSDYLYSAFANSFGVEGLL